MILFGLAFITTNLTFILLLSATVAGFINRKNHKLFIKSFYIYLGVGFIGWLTFHVLKMKPYTLMDNSGNAGSGSALLMMQLIMIISVVFIYIYYLIFTIVKAQEEKGDNKRVAIIWITLLVNISLFGFYAIPLFVGDFLHGGTYILGDGTITLNTIINMIN